jgi:hypothetical protein
MPKKKNIMYKHTNQGKNAYHVYDSKGNGYALLPGHSVLLDVKRVWSQIVVEEVVIEPEPKIDIHEEHRKATKKNKKAKEVDKIEEKPDLNKEDIGGN